ILAWTTTPWTLPANLALAVGPEIEYSILQNSAGERFIIADERRSAYEKELTDFTVVGSVTGAELVGRSYTPMFDFFADTPNAFRVLSADFVTTQEGTGVVHMAPGFGEDDQVACLAADIATVCPMDEHGCYTSEVAPWTGVHVFDANPDVIRSLKEKGVVLRHETYDHPYPHCWRCSEPLVYRAVSSWFVKVTAIKDRMVELNQDITWVPEHLKDGSFGKWISNARDWAISRNRFWGSPIPVWKSDDPNYPRVDAYGSLADLSRDFGVEVTDLHRPAVDELVRPNPDDPTGMSMMRRVPEVLDCWFESGSMPYAQVHYPFENREWFEDHYPGDFIVEYIGQTRGWFYTLHVLATALFDRPAFSTCVSHGIVLGDDGVKMSKSLQNYPDPMKVFDTYGADAMRWYLLSSAILRGTDFSVTEQGIRDTVRQVLLPLWNSWYFLSLYANAENKSGAVSTESSNLLDRYILAKLQRTTVDVTLSMDKYDLFAACQQVRTFLDVLTNWYIRRSRDRFWAGDQDAINTLHTVLEVLVRLAAPLLPLITENIHAGLVANADSVHLRDWPSSEALPTDDELVDAMDLVRDVCSATLSVRKAHGRRVRLPLGSLTVAVANAEALASYVTIISDEVNVKSVMLRSDVAAVASFELQVVPAALGPRLGKKTQQVIGAVKRGEWSRVDDAIAVAGEILTQGEYLLKLVTSGDEPSATLSHGSGIVMLDIEVTPDLEAEGLARDIIRAVQQARRDEDLDVSDRITLTVAADSAVEAQVGPFVALVMAETLATELLWDQQGAREISIEGHMIGVLVKIAR
ncbi:MAG: isoleucine--tRNA ligase, partial [Ilumatobacteraceae bacterium]|nr:isoleucine--tRNA ligase [Ilumatobacteraceae bacterium]